jgi:hypothetical protein
VGKADVYELNAGHRHLKSRLAGVFYDLKASRQLRIETGKPLLRAYPRARMTSAAPRHCAISSGRRSIMPLCIPRPASYPSSSARNTAPTFEHGGTEQLNPFELKSVYRRLRVTPQNPPSGGRMGESPAAQRRLYLGATLAVPSLNSTPVNSHVPLKLGLP